MNVWTSTILMRSLDDSSRAFHHNWDKAADECVAILHTAAGRDPYDRALTDLIGELSRTR